MNLPANEGVDEGTYEGANEGANEGATGSAPVATGEFVDVVDVHDQVIDTVARSVMRAHRLCHRAVFIAVRHPDGGLLIHQRSFDKDLWPGQWDIAVGGVVTAGEPYDDAARRELAEEIGLVGTEPVRIGGGAYDDPDVSLIGRCYTITAAGPFDFADGEVVAAEWVQMSELDALVRQRAFLPDSLALLLPLLSES